MKFDQLYQQLMESMSRRNFLGLVGKGAAAVAGSNIVPAGVSSMLKATTSPNFAFNNAVLSFADLVSSVFCSAEDPWGIKDIPTDVWGILNRLELAIGEKAPNLIVNNDVVSGFAYKIGDLSDILMNDGILDQIAAAKKSGDLNLIDMEKLQIFSDTCEDLITELIPSLVKHGVMTKGLARDLKERGFDVENFLEKPSQPNKPNTSPQADNIDYSRFDRAGGSEDEGYAKYYEKSTHKKALL